MFSSIGSAATSGSCAESVSGAADGGVAVETFISTIVFRFSGAGWPSVCSGSMYVVMFCGESGAASGAGLILLVGMSLLLGQGVFVGMSLLLGQGVFVGTPLLFAQAIFVVMPLPVAQVEAITSF
jgi:hypothetical protein